MNYRLMLSVAVLAAGVSVRGWADTVDQQQLYTYARVSSGTGNAESFVPSNNNVSGLSVETDNHIAATGNITVSLWDALPNQAGANMLASGTVNNVHQGQWVDVFWAPVTVTPGNTYFAAFSSSTSFEGFAGTTTNSYPNGVAYTVDASSNPYVAFPNLDFAFKSWAQVPEPSSVALFSIGGAALFVLARRRFAR